MHSITWAPGDNAPLDLLFNDLREIQYNDKSHRLWQNYNTDHFTDCVAYTITFDGDVPLACGSIAVRDCWPAGAYRIFNRLWKPNQRTDFLRRVSPSMGSFGHSQVAWLSANTDCKLYFISRETDNWQDWMINSFNAEFNLSFSKNNHRYLTCNNESCLSCWQKIIYNGDSSILTNWKHK